MPLVSVQPIRQVAEDPPASLPKIQCHKALFIESRPIEKAPQLPQTMYFIRDVPKVSQHKNTAPSFGSLENDLCQWMEIQIDFYKFFFP